uniref:F-box/kelch-repeat protein n=1 Tax=Noccaea caerulescens TaxID=107243 RepID=A0A1J3FTC0_NOCCA
MKRSVRSRRKKTIENNLTRSKNREESDENENDPFSRITVDLKKEILMKLPAKSVAKLAFVSKTWASIIRSKEFTDLYMTRSSTRPRLLFKVHRHGDHFYHSCSQEDPSRDHQRVTITQIRNPIKSYDFSPPSGGLVCCLSDSSKVLLVGNPSTGQFVPLPKVRTRRLGIVAFFGYDHVSDVYKVLCMTVKNVKKQDRLLVVSEEHQVYTLGAEKKAWRLINCQHPHLPPFHTNGLCINGVLFYYAWTRNKGSLMSFDLRSEEFSVIKLPENVRLLQDFCSLVNYGGKIALSTRLYEGTLDLCVLEDASKQEWSKVSVVVPCGSDLSGRYMFWFRGALSTGELIFASYSPMEPFYLLSYDPKEDIAEKVVIEGIGDQFSDVRVYHDHVDSPLFLSNES